MAYDNKRKFERLSAFWKVYRDEISWGYLIDLSETGVRVWLNKEEKIDEAKFSIRINPPKELNLDSIDLAIQQIWMNPNKSQRFIEIGCKFQSLSGSQKKQLDQLILFFKKYNAKEEALP